MHTNRRTKRLLVVLSAVAAALVGGALANPLGSAPAGTGNTTNAQQTATLVANLGVLRTSRSTADAAPPNVISALEQEPNTTIEPSGSRLAFSNAQDGSVYVVPTTDGRACLADSSLSEVVCAGLAEINSGLASGGDACSPTLGQDTVDVAGLLPDGATDVSLRLSDGQMQPTSLTNNAYLVRFKRSAPLPTTIVWTSGDVQQSAPVALPSDAATMKCAAPPTADEAAAAKKPFSATVHYNE